MAYQHYKECSAVGQFPDDSVVRRNAAIISELESNFERNENFRAMSNLSMMSLMSGGRR